MLARAFCDNPLDRAVMPSLDPQRRLSATRAGMRALLPSAIECGVALAALRDGVACGALVSSPPPGLPLPPPSWPDRIRCWFGQGLGVARRWAEVFDALQAIRPVDPHWYLGTLGVDPARQRAGVGTALLRHWLVEVDHDRLPAYLETDSARNVAFYRRFGFEVSVETELFDVPIRCMRREAR